MQEDCMLEEELAMDFDESGEMNIKNLRNHSNDSCDEGMSEDDVVDEGIPNNLYQKQSANLENLVSTKQESSGISKKKQKAPVAQVKVQIDHTKILDLRNYDGSWSCTQDWLYLFKINDQDLNGVNKQLKSDYERDVLATLISLAFIQANQTLFGGKISIMVSKSKVWLKDKMKLSNVSDVNNMIATTKDHFSDRF